MNTWSNILCVLVLCTFVQMSMGLNCTNQTTCNGCRADHRCSWCSSPRKCLEGTIHGLSRPKECPDPKNVFRDFCCEEATSCNSCASLYGCGWCAESEKCVEVGDQESCSGRPKDSVHQCTTLQICQHYKSCHECTRDSNCGWCEGTKKCSAGASIQFDTAEKCTSGWTLECPEKCEPVVGTSEYCGSLPSKVCSAYGPLDASSFNVANHYFASVLHEQMINATCLHANSQALDKELYCSGKPCLEDADCQTPKKMCHSLCMDCYKSETICDDKVKEGIVSVPGEASCSFTIEEKTNFGTSLKNTIGWNVLLLFIWWIL